ncbi:NADH-quinone oxidoreductase subunit N [Niabella drilacis]|uniref:NADH-quinone oxidoreductase subunit N n=1 Tax=Niabella drilacis (strain DSM 25811 / CCM 8410 / CCUG 62505 / LMG 26954 / E90) TaxID=1285928 RepID=A0A1G6VJ48_NIADE|nr:NADH-quinone oxidoreductase subunit N [Niabella drilacis]SDD53670.1 NADH-quinone oxidoreductase subunit N [Niabella drilacis]
MNAVLLSGLLGVVMMFASFLFRTKAPVRILAILGTVVLLVANIMETKGVHFFHMDTAAFLSFSNYALFFNTIAIAGTLVFFLVSSKDMQRVGNHYAEYFALIFFILTGIFLVTAFTNLLILFIGIEIISIPLYILTGSAKKDLKSNEAALKYFLMGAFSTGIMLMGIALIYGATGTFEIGKMNMTALMKSNLLTGGMLMLLFSMCFKVSVAPFHFWTPDVYDGAPNVFTSFMATIVKVGIFVGFLHLFYSAFEPLSLQWKLWMAILAALTLLVGNITAVFQQSVKRMLAYSSISQAGFMMFALVAMNETAHEGLLLYSIAYSLATIGIFGVISKMSDYSFDGFNGLANHQPLVALCVTIFMLSLAGIPLSAGFLAKFYMLKAVIQGGGYMWLVILGVLMAAVSAYYYFRVIQAMYFKEGPSHFSGISTFEKYVLVGICVLIVFTGLFPNVIFSWLYF